jgi:hypothetical protein
MGEKKVTMRVEWPDFSGEMEMVDAKRSPSGCIDLVLKQRGVGVPLKIELPPYASDPKPEGRGISPEVLREWEIGHDVSMRRLLFPLRDRKGRLMAVSGRLYETKHCVRCLNRSKEKVPLVVRLENGEVFVLGTVPPEREKEIDTAASGAR